MASNYSVKVEAPTIEHGLITQYGRTPAEAKRNLQKKLCELYRRDVDLKEVYHTIDFDWTNDN